MTTRTFALKRTGDVDLVFDGECLVDVSSRKAARQSNWTEIRIFRVTTGQYVTEVVGGTAIKGQTARRNVTVVDAAAGVKEALKRPANEHSVAMPKGTMYLTDFALAALNEAAMKDEALAATLVERL